jgi:hypothetical protein
MLMNDIVQPLKENVNSRNTMNATKSGMENYYFGNVLQLQLLRVQEPSLPHGHLLRKVQHLEAVHPPRQEVEEVL